MPTCGACGAAFTKSNFARCGTAASRLMRIKSPNAMRAPARPMCSRVPRIGYGPTDAGGSRSHYTELLEEIAMKLDESPRSDNVEDERGSGIGRRAGIGIGTIAIVVIGYFLGVDPSTLLSLLNG